MQVIIILVRRNKIVFIFNYALYYAVFCTCSEAFSFRVVDNIEPTHLIIDEAAMATEPEAMIPIKLVNHVTLIGDHMQLQVYIDGYCMMTS